MSKHYKLVLFIRFLGHLSFMAGIVAFVFILGPLLEVEFNYRKDQLLGVKRVVPNIVTSTPANEDLGAGFASLTADANVIVPVSTEFGIVIEKINANAKIIAHVNPSDEKDYVKALSLGVAHANGTNFPGENGNIYLFSHSTDAPWNIIRYNAIFYLLRELEPGDKVVVFYKNRRYNYVVYDKTTAEASDVSFLTNKYNKSVLTLQTCDPPGTLLRRLIVRAQLEGDI